ncbi:hypothetical protein EYZ11_001239 [Aspergillus tanneri]|uniref:Uncharacterized protein n=1 Tax=Aspergillus tanneri TaxID=1220188 RepID=A0A4V6RQY7_9EURO|nr:hypothetical protein EYZ11_001239 [Aspergillus tanneri]
MAPRYNAPSMFQNDRILKRLSVRRTRLLVPTTPTLGFSKGEDAAEEVVGQKTWSTSSTLIRVFTNVIPRAIWIRLLLSVLLSLGFVFGGNAAGRNLYLLVSFVSDSPAATTMISPGSCSDSMSAFFEVLVFRVDSEKNGTTV